MSNSPAFLRRRHQLIDLGTLTSGLADLIKLLTLDRAGHCTTDTAASFRTETSVR